MLSDILKTAGTALLSATPFGAAAIPIINSFLPGDKKLAENATGQQAQSAINELPPELKIQLESQKIDLQKVQEQGRTERYKAMCQSDGQETRAKLVNKAMNTLIILSLLFAAATAWVYMQNGAESAFSIEMAGVFITITGTFAYVVRAYFGDLRTETKSRHTTIDEKPQPEGFLSKLFKG